MKCGLTPGIHSFSHPLPSYHHKTYRGVWIRERSSIDSVAEEAMMWVAGKVCGLYLIKVGLPSSIHRTTLYCRFCISPLIIITSSVTFSEWDRIRINHSFFHPSTKMQILLYFFGKQKRPRNDIDWNYFHRTQSMNNSSIRAGALFNSNWKQPLESHWYKKLCTSFAFQFEFRGNFLSTCHGNVLPCLSRSMICTTI